MRVTKIKSVQQDGWSRVSALVDGRELYFEASGTTLVGSPEGFACALLPVAALGGRRIKMDSPLDPHWLAGVDRLMHIWNQWWQTPAALGEVLTATAGPRLAVDSPGGDDPISLCFSLGVDSFYSLLRSGQRIDRLVFVEGYDVRLADVERLAALATSQATVSSAMHLPLIRVRTNLRDHPAYSSTDWSYSHGGALAAIGHFLGPGVLMVSSTKDATSTAPWGSHWMTDSLWSSHRVHIAHVGAERRRAEKLTALLDEPLVQRHLRVCWMHRGIEGNCCACEKCVRTMLVLQGCGRLADFPVFVPRAPLPDLVDRIPTVPGYLIPGYQSAVASLAPHGEVRMAVDRLVMRSKAALISSVNNPPVGIHALWGCIVRCLGRQRAQSMKRSPV